jgi:hypothetical protein
MERYQPIKILKDKKKNMCLVSHEDKIHTTLFIITLNSHGTRHFSVQCPPMPEERHFICSDGRCTASSPVQC